MSCPESNLTILLIKLHLQSVWATWVEYFLSDMNYRVSGYSSLLIISKFDMPRVNVNAVA
jgi:hypothetical protein